MTKATLAVMFLTGCGLGALQGARDTLDGVRAGVAQADAAYAMVYRQAAQEARRLPSYAEYRAAMAPHDNVVTSFQAMELRMDKADAKLSILDVMPSTWWHSMGCVAMALEHLAKALEPVSVQLSDTITVLISGMESYWGRQCSWSR